MRLVPVDGKTPDWPRKVADAIKALWLAVKVLQAETAYSVATVTFTPQAAPGSPVEGMTYMDSTTHKLRTWDGSAWQDHW